MLHKISNINNINVNKNNVNKNRRYRNPWRILAF